MASGFRGKGPAVLVEGAVEAADLGAQTKGELALVHGFEELGGHGHEGVRMLGALVQHAGKAVGRQQADILGEHGEQTAHEEGGGFFRRGAFVFEALGHLGEVSGDFAGGLGAFERRVEAGGVVPDRVQARLHAGVGQILQGDVAALGVGEGAVVAALAGEVGVDIDAAPDIADQDERRAVMVGVQAVGVVPGLGEGIAHQAVPAGLALPRLLFFQSEQVGLTGDRLGPTLKARLLGLQDEGVLLVEVDPQRLALVAAHWVLKAIGRAGDRRAGRMRRRQVQRRAQFPQEHRIVGPLRAADQPSPPLDKFVDTQRWAPGVHFT